MSRTGWHSPGGSSPRVRGKHCPTPPIWRASGLIPACAGKTNRITGPVSRIRAHPRVCGENHATRKSKPKERGSSPRVRGKPMSPVRPAGLNGLIPACAGKTTRTASSGRSSRAHPRVCGENWCARQGWQREKGSSPRVRGKQLFTRRPLRWWRLIPACAGKTPAVVPRPDSGRAHPRVCGENVVGEFEEVSGAGSSPRVRGKPRLAGYWIGIAGLIPACAGKTPASPATSRQPTAHPRVCGENAGLSSAASLTAGSSPRVRGKQRGVQLTNQSRGLIPACAGKTDQITRVPIGTRAHPRVCGENF